jgi:spermidine synthase
VNPANQTAPRAALALCGFTAVTGQIVLMRELIQVFNGNEIALGILLATWLFWTAVGSALASVLTRSPNSQPCRARWFVAALEIALAAGLPATLWALRSSKAFFQTVPGELVGPAPMLLTSLVCLSVFCVASGALFVAAARLIAQEGNLSARAAASAAYLVEAAGAALGGVLSSVVFVRVLDAFQIAAIVGLLNLSVAAALLFRMKRAHVALLAVAAALAAVPLLVWIAPRCDAAARARLWRGFHVVAERDSIYGNLTVTETGAIDTGTIRSLYENGSILANAPDPAAAEEAVDYALLEHAAPRRVLLIGGGVNGSVAEALKHPTVASLDYVELDPALIAMAQQYFPAQTAAFRPGSRATDSRVHLHFLDGRRFLAETKEKFDVIIVDVPDPQTAQLNRFYTVEFFRMARAHLAPNGLFAVELRSSEETISPDLAEFLRSIRRTLGAVFPYQTAIPGETIHFFGAAEPGVLTSDPQLLVARLRERHLNTQYVREYFIPYRMMPDRMEQVETDLAPLASTPVNRDFAPVAYAFDVVLWSAQFRSSYTVWFRAAEHIEFSKVAGALAIALLIGVAFVALLPGRERRERAAAGVSVAATGFTLMALQIFLLLGFQAVYGYVYTELAILIGLFMAGITLGSWLGTRDISAVSSPDSSAGLQTGCRAGIHARTGQAVPGTRIEGREHSVSGHGAADREENHSRGSFVKGHDFSRAEKAAKSVWALAPAHKLNLATIQLLLALSAPALLLAVTTISDFSSRKATWLAAQIVFPALAALAGMLGGFQFVTAAGIFLRGRGEGAGLGLLYAIDLLGGCVGALALSTFLIPVFGFWRTAWLVAAINAAALLLVLRASANHSRVVREN